MITLKKLFILSFLFSVLMVSCSDDDKASISKASLGYQYAPLIVGKELVYQVDSISYDEFTGLVDTSVFYYRELIEESYIDLEGNTAYLVGVYSRIADTSAWFKKQNISKKIVGRRFEKLENNTITIPLVFPLGENVSWDVNALNSAATELYAFKALHESLNVNGINYDSVLVVDQRDDQNLIEQFLEEEKYAAQVGLIQKRKLAIQTEFNGTIRNGTDVRMNLISYN